MRLKNKKTGEIKAFDEVMREAYKWNNYNSLAELNAEWCDVEEEPKEGWFIQSNGLVKILQHGYGDNDYFVDMVKEIGNYFETKEEAEKAVERLKALAEAKEDGLKIKGYYYNHEDLVILADIGKCNKFTLDELFGKEID